MPNALRPGKDCGATIPIGSKAITAEGSMRFFILVPLMKIKPPDEELMDLIERISGLPKKPIDIFNNKCSARLRH